MTEPSDFQAILSPRVRKLARSVLESAKRKGLCIATAESCTGGLLSTLLTDLPGVSHCFECGFVVYSDEAKSKLLGIAPEVIKKHGAVSSRVAQKMATQALDRCDADVAIAITGFAGPSSSGDEEVGLVFIAAARSGSKSEIREFHFGEVGRDLVRLRALECALDLLADAIRLP